MAEPQAVLNGILARVTAARSRRPDFQQGEGPDRLPQGGAAEANAGAQGTPTGPPAVPPAGQGAPGAPPPEQAPGGAGGPSVPPPGQPQSLDGISEPYGPVDSTTEESRFLLGAPQMPGLSSHDGIHQGGYAVPDQLSIRRMLTALPLLNQAAEAVDAPQQVRDLRNMVVRSLYSAGLA